jgi:uncharacterized membrane protein YwzB
MTKNQKIWFLIFLAIFAVPEVLWSPVNSFYRDIGISPFEFRGLINSNNFFGDNLTLAKVILCVQLIGLLIGFWIVSISRFDKKLIKLSSSVFLGLLILFVAYILVFAFVSNPHFG